MLNRRLLLCLLAVLGAPGSGVAVAAPPLRLPVILGIGATRVTVPSAGGSTRVSVRVKNVTACSWSGAWAGSALRSAHRSTACVGSTFELPANPGSAPRTWVVRVTARGSGGRSASAQIAIRQPGKPPPPPPVDATTTPSTPPPSLTMDPVTQPAGIAFTSSDNWAGYLVSGGPFTATKGTFVIPNLAASASNSETAEWIGVDSSHAGVLQAGVTEAYDASQRTVRVFAWWEILPTKSVNVPLPVHVGDQVTVTIAQTASDTWGIWITNDTTGQYFSVARPYSGTGATAEWIVEAPYTSAGVQYILGQFTSGITFSDLGVAGPQSTLTPYTMSQHGATVAVPSFLGTSAFSVAYGALQPDPPR